MSSDFRGLRKKIPIEYFLNGKDVPATDMIDKDIWIDIFHLSDHVALVTSEHYGRQLKIIVNSINRFTSIGLIVQMIAKDSVMDYVTLDTHDEFQSSLFNAVNGFYRLAYEPFRNVLEYMTFGLEWTLANKVVEVEKWRTGEVQFRFSNTIKLLSAYSTINNIENKSAQEGVYFLQKLRIMYGEMCKYTHGMPGKNNADIWRSNGPVFIADAFETWIEKFASTMMIGILLIKIAYPRINKVKEKWYLSEFYSDLSKILRKPEEIKEFKTLGNIIGIAY